MLKKLITTCIAAALLATALTTATAATAVENAALETTALGTTAATDVRVMSFNIHHGADASDVLNLERIAQDIEASGAKIIGLQEVDDHWSSRSAFVDQAAWLAVRLGMNYAYGANLDRAPQPGQTARSRYGNAILSTYPILSSKNNLLTNIVYAENPSEQRGLLEASIAVNGTTVDFYTTHLDASRSEQRQSQVNQILTITGASTRPSVLVGDLNAFPNSPEVQNLMTQFTDTFAALGQNTAYTYPAANPTSRIDYILTRGAITPWFAQVIQTTSSDHLPIIVDLTIA